MAVAFELVRREHEALSNTVLCSNPDMLLQRLNEVCYGVILYLGIHVTVLKHLCCIVVMRFELFTSCIKDLF